MVQNFLQLNKDRTEVTAFEAKEKQLKICLILLKSTKQARNLGVIINSSELQTDLEKLVRAFDFSSVD